MSNRILSLALRITGDASGVRLTPVERALQRLGEETAKVGSVFEKFAKDSELGAKAQADFAAEAARLQQSLRDGSINSREYADSFARLAESARAQATALEEGRRITEQYRTEEERRAIALERLDRLLEKSAIDQETYNRAVADASGANAEAARAATEATQRQAEAARVQADSLRQRQALESRAAQVINANLTAQERYEQSLRELNDLQRQGLLTQDQYNRAVASARKPLDDAAAAGKRVAEAGKESSLRFNELSGVFAVLPGPLGSIAGRISGIASASEGLSRIFAGGLSSGISNLVGSFTALLNPVTLALGGITAFAAGATAVARSLVALEDRVERLGRLADQLGVSFEFVQVLEEAGKRADVSVEQLSGSFARLQNTLAGADEESKKANAALQRLGVSVQDFQALSQRDQIQLIGRQLASIEDPAQRSAAAIALFGRSGVSLLPFFRELPGAASDIERFGAAVSDEDRDRLASLGSAFDAIGVSLTALGQELALPFAGLLEGITNAIADAIGAVTNAIRPFLEVITPGLDALGQTFTAWGQRVFAASTQATGVLEDVGEMFSNVFELISGIVEGVGPGIIAYYDALINTITRLAQVFFDSYTTIFNAINSLTASVAGLFGFGDSVSGVGDAIGQAFGFVYEILSQVVTVLGNFIEVANRVATVVVVGITKAVDAVVRLVTEFLRFTGLGSALSALGGLIGQVFGSVASVFGTIASAIGGTVGELLTLAERFLGIDRSARETSAAVDGVAASVEKAAEGTRELVAQQEQSAEAAKKQADSVQRIVDANLEQIRIDSEFGGDSARFRAAENLLVIQQEIARVEEQLRAAREASDQAAINAATSRLATLDQVAARENDIASGARKQREEAAAAAEKASQDAAREAERAAREVTRIAEQRAKDLARLDEQIEEQWVRRGVRQYEIELERAQELANVRAGSIEISDIRSGGISAFFDTLREDPAIAEAKKQSKELEQIRKGIAALQAEKVEILAGTG